MLETDAKIDVTEDVDNNKSRIYFLRCTIFAVNFLSEFKEQITVSPFINTKLFLFVTQYRFRYADFHKNNCNGKDYRIGS